MRYWQLLLLAVLIAIVLLLVRSRLEPFLGGSLSQGTCICDNRDSGNAPGSPGYMCFAYQDSAGNVIPTCNNPFIASEQDCTTGCRKKYCSWNIDKQGFGQCINKGTPAPPAPPGPGDNHCLNASNFSCDTGCGLYDSSGDLIKCYGNILDSPTPNVCDCPAKDASGNIIPIDPATDRMACNQCSQCKYCDATQKCMSRKNYAKMCRPGPGPGPSPNPSPPPGPFPACSPQQSAAQEAQNKASLLRDIRKVIHNEMMRDRSMTTANAQPMYQTESKGSALLSNDPSLLQGQEHGRGRPSWCPKDMNEYIRKDSIPCYGCTLDY